MSDYVEQMAYATGTQKPWHGLGATLDAGASIERWTEQAGLDWKTFPLPIMVQGRETQRCAHDYRALVRSDTGDVLDVVSKQYKPVQNLTMMATMERFMSGLQVEMETAGSLKGGRIVWALGKVPNSRLSVSGDYHEAYVLVSTGHQSGYAFQARPTAERVVCINTLSMARGQKGNGKFHHNHRSRWTDATTADAYNIVSASIQGLEDYARQMERYQQISLGQEETQKYVLELLQPQLLNEALARTQAGQYQGREIPKADDHVLGAQVLEQMLAPRVEIPTEDFSRPVKRMLEAITTQPGARPGTLANAFNGTTYYVDHVRGRNRDSGLTAAWFGAGANLKQNAYELAGNIAKIARA